MHGQLLIIDNPTLYTSDMWDSRADSIKKITYLL